MTDLEKLSLSAENAGRYSELKKLIESDVISKLSLGCSLNIIDYIKKRMKQIEEDR